MLAAGVRKVILALDNRVVKNVLWNALRFVGPVLLFLFFTPILIHRMGTENYGLWTLAVSVVGLTGVFELRLSTVISKYVAKYSSSKDADGLSATVTIGFTLYLMIGILLTVPIYMAAPQVAKLFTNSTISSDHVEGAIRLASLGFFALLLKS